MDDEKEFQEAVDYIQNLTVFGWKPGLERFSVLCERLGNPQNRLRCIHIGGTNGKGSVTAMGSSILSSAGYKVGSYYSPFVYDIRERIQINGSMIDKKSFVRITNSIKQVAEDIGKTELQHPTEFEVKTAIAFMYFVEQNVDFAVLEVGLGGRLDATNVVNPLVSVITNVTMDHMDRLGNTIAEIAYEKAGIIKPNGHLVTASTDPDALAVFMKACKERNSSMWRVIKTDEAKYEIVPVDTENASIEQNNILSFPREGKSNGRFDVVGINHTYYGLQAGMKGYFQEVNAATAIGAIERLQSMGYNIDESAVRDGISNAHIPGRFELISESPRILVDGAHNKDAVTKLSKALKLEYKYRRLILIVGMLSGHSMDHVIGTLGPLADVFIATASQNERSVPAEKVAEVARKYCNNVVLIGAINDAIAAAVSIASEDDLICITGSFYLMNEIPNRFYKSSKGPGILN